MFGQAKNSTPPWKMPGAMGWDNFVEDSMENEKTEVRMESKQEEPKKEASSIFKGSEGTLFVFSTPDITRIEVKNHTDNTITPENNSGTDSNFDYGKWLGVGLDSISSAANVTFTEAKAIGAALGELTQPFIAKPEAPKKNPEDEKKKLAQAMANMQRLQQTQAGIKQAQEIREMNEDTRSGVAGLSTEQVSGETGVQSGFRSRNNTYTRAFLGLKFIWETKKQLQKQSAYQMASGRGKNVVNLNAAPEGGTGGAKMNISSTGGGAG